MKIAMAQVNTTVGDLEENFEKIKGYIRRAEGLADLVIFPELAMTGYPPQDLLYEKSFVRENKILLEKISEECRKISSVVGFVDYDPTRKGRDGTEIKFNTAGIFSQGRFLGVQHKTLLPTYDVFDEERYFTPAKTHTVFRINGINLGVEICEDLWDEDYETKVTRILVEKGADLIVNLSASPFYQGKRFVREETLAKKARENKVPMFYVNLVGGQDELVFDGQSLAVDREGKLIALGEQFQEDLVVVEIDLKTKIGREIRPPEYNREEEIFNSLVLGVGDYFRKTGFERAVLGLSGGIDSSLVAVIAAEALGKENVIGLSMASKYSSEESKTDAKKLAENLGIIYVEFPIQGIVESYHRALEEPLERLRKALDTKEEEDDPVADENLQPRVRGNCLMDISNRLGGKKILVLNTGNKTEMALGYCTLYGDLTGGIGVISDVSKLEVYRLARYLNEKAGREIIPGRVLVKRPSAELRENQFDPFDYDIVSPLVDEIIEHRKSKSELIEMEYPREVVEDTYRRIRNAEYKRRQAPPGIKITPKAFGIGWKMPIVNKYIGEYSS